MFNFPLGNDSACYADEVSSRNVHLKRLDCVFGTGSQSSTFDWTESVNVDGHGD